MLELREVVVKGFPNDQCNLSATLRSFWDVQHHLTMEEKDSMLVMGAVVVIIP
jgi:hypothetical protein